MLILLILLILSTSIIPFSLSSWLIILQTKTMIVYMIVFMIVLMINFMIVFMIVFMIDFIEILESLINRLIYGVTIVQ